MRDYLNLSDSCPLLRIWRVAERSFEPRPEAVALNSKELSQPRLQLGLAQDSRNSVLKCECLESRV